MLPNDMNEKLDKYLCEKYPKIFVERRLPVSESCMGRGFECGNGWFYLIDSLCHSIQEYIDGSNKYPQEGKAAIPQMVFTQVKEKFGALRIYYTGGDDYCSGLLDMAECMSYRMCENCGTFGKDVGRVEKGWIQSLCTECAEMLKKDIVYNEELRKLVKSAGKERTTND